MSEGCNLVGSGPPFSSYAHNSVQSYNSVHSSVHNSSVLSKVVVRVMRSVSF